MTEKRKENQLDIAILVVEDEAATLEEISQMLRRQVRQVVTAGNGAEGLAAFHDCCPDLVITDIRMPRMDGLEMIRRIREADQETPVIIMTAHSDFTLMSEAISGGVDSYVLKPVDYEQLLGAIRKAAKAVMTRKALAASQEQLAASEEMYRAVIETSEDGFCVADREGRILQVNSRYEELSGYSAEELRGMHIHALDASETTEETKEHIRRIIGEGSDLFNTRLRRKDGTVWQAEINATFWKIGDGKLFIFARNIIKRKRSEVLLKTRYELSRMAVSGSIDELLQSALAAMELHTGSAIGFFHFVDEDQETLTLQAWSADTLDNICSTTGKGEHYPISRAGVWVDCVAVRRPVIHNDYAALPHRKGMPEGHAPVIRELVVPVLRNDRIIAIAGVGNKSVDYDTDDVEMVQELASLVMDLVIHKQAEERLLESEYRYRMLFEKAGDYVFVLELPESGLPVIVDANEAALRTHGYSRDELIGRPISLIDPDSSPETIAARAASLNKDGSGLLEARHKRKDGTLFDVEVNMQAVRLGKRQLLLSIERDITERQRMARSLADSEALYRNLIETTAAVAWEVDIASLRFTYVSPQIGQMTGYPAEQWTDFSFWADHIHSEDRSSAVAFCQAETSKGLDHDFEYRMLAADGSIVWIRDVVSVITEQGRPATLRGYFINITGNKKAEERIRENELFIRNILNTVDEGFIVLDREYRILTANKSYCAMADLPCSEVTGRHCYEISHKAEIPCYEAGEECAVRDAFSTGLPHTVSHCHRDREGNVVYVETKAYPMKNAAGEITSVIETISNITEKYLLEEERLKSQKLESIGTLAGGIAHDFNNLLQGVFGYISLAKLVGENRQKSQAALEEAEKALHLTVKLTNQLLTFSKGGKPVMQPVDIRQVVENAVRFALSGSRSDCRLTVPEDLLQVQADDGQISQVVQNILLNADQAMPEGGAISIVFRNITIPSRDMTVELKPGEYVAIAIQDQGIGIPHQYLTKIFDPYFTTKEKGSGLGLATSYSIVRNHGGQIAVSSVPGEGSIFTLYLPAVRATAPEVPLQQAAAPKRSARILVMDDEEIVRMIVGELLAALGHDVAFAEHGAAACEAYAAAQSGGRPYDMAILDLTIRGGMGGEETVRKLRELDPAVRAVVASGYSDDEVIANYRAYGFAAYLKKPFHIEELQKVINDVLG